MADAVHPRAGITSLANRAGWYAGLTLPSRGESFVAIDRTTRIFRAVAADGRPLVAEAQANVREGRFVDVGTTVQDVGGNLVSTASSIGALRCITLNERNMRVCSLSWSDLRLLPGWVLRRAPGPVGGPGRKRQG